MRGRHAEEEEEERRIPSERPQYKSTGMLKCPLTCQTTQNAFCLQFHWSCACRQGALGLAALAVTLLSPRKCLLPQSAMGKLEGRHSDRQTDKPQAAQRSGVEIAVTSHRKSLLTGMLHCSDTTKWAFTDKTHRKKSVGLTGGQEQNES